VWSLGIGTDTSELGPEWLNAKIERHPQGNGWEALEGYGPGSEGGQYVIQTHKQCQHWNGQSLSTLQEMKVGVPPTLKSETVVDAIVLIGVMANKVGIWDLWWLFGRLVAAVSCSAMAELPSTLAFGTLSTPVEGPFHSLRVCTHLCIGLAILKWNEAPRDFGGRGRSSGRGSGWGSGWSVSIGGRIRFALALVGKVALLAALVACDVGSMVGVLHKVGESSHGRGCTLGILDTSSGAPFPIVLEGFVTALSSVEDLGVVVALGKHKARAAARVM
jgi:hypothetical protein